MDAVFLGLLAGALFGAMTVAVRTGLFRGGDPILGSVVMTSSAFLVTVLIALLVTEMDDTLSELWPFLLIGLAVPGLSQIGFIQAVRWAGPSRTAILVGTAPLLSVLLAIAFLGEPLEPVLLIGTAFVVLGGIVLAFDPGRPTGFRRIGVVFALLCATAFAFRDNAIRGVARDIGVSPLGAAAASLLGATLATGAIVLVARRDATRSQLRLAVRSFLPAGVLLALAYATLVAGFDRGSVGIIAPLNATQSLWGVVFAALFYHNTEAIGRRTVLASMLVVVGGVLIGVFR
ncbi:MAG: DMT family transporter [Thermoleophilia bacterium]|nr:DMT family transporter [Thermoleophilia bacterium]